MKKIVTVLGARPQFIKASVVSAAISEAGGLSEVIVHTGQHYDANMSDIFFDELAIAKPSHYLGINRGTHGRMTGAMLAGIESVLTDEAPDLVLVYGDTNSTLAGALAAVKLGIPVAHVEAGLRSFNMSMPEEVNRIVTDRISRWLFAPTDAAVAHLMREGADGARVFLVGDVMYDVSLHHGKRVNPGEGAMSALGLVAGRYVLATIHRAENTNRKDRLSAIVDGLLELSRNLVVVWPIHPRTRAVLRDIGKLRSVEESLRLIDPLGYLEMVRLEKYAGVIATDSGGVQKEAFFHRVPCITLRDETEWVELIESGWNRLVPPISGRVICQSILSAVGRVGANVNPYGNGYAARRIVHELSRV